MGHNNRKSGTKKFSGARGPLGWLIAKTNDQIFRQEVAKEKVQMAAQDDFLGMFDNEAGKKLRGFSDG